MIRGILFTIIFILLAVTIGLSVYFGYKKCNEDLITPQDIKNQVQAEYEDEVRWVSDREKKKAINDKYDAILKEKLENFKPEKSKFKIPFIASIVASIALIITVILVPGSAHQVNTGEVAVVRNMGKIVDLRQAGTYFDFYMVNKYEYYDTKVQQDRIITSAYSKDGQTMDLEVFLQYQVQPENIMKIATEYGSLDALQARIETVAVEKTKAVMSSAEAMTIVQNRAQFSIDVSDTVRAGISDDYYVNVKDVVLTNIDFTDEFEKSVENKVIAEQDRQTAVTKAEAEKEAAIIKAQQELETAKIEAERKVTQANGDAEAQLIAANAAGKAATAKFAELAKSLGYDVVEDESGYTINTTTGPGIEKFKPLVEDYLNYLAYLSTWDGKLPEVISGDDAVSIIVPNN